MIRIVCLILCFASLSLRGQTTNANVRPITLEEVIALALQHNLDIQIQRFLPQIELLRLESSYGAFDPALTLDSSQRFRSDEGRFDPSIGQIPANRSYTENFGASIDGTIPYTGTTYDLFSTLNRVSGTIPQIVRDPFGNVVDVVTIDRSFQYAATAGVTLTQPLLRNFWYNPATYAILFNKKSVQMSELALATRIMDIITRVEETYYQLLLARELVKVQQKALELAERTLTENRKRVEVGAMAPLDEKQAESLVASSRADLLIAQRNQSFQENALKNLITDSFSAWHPLALDPVENLLPTVIPFDLQESWRKALTMRPDIREMRIQLEQRDITLKYLKNQTLPALDLVGSYGHNGVDQNFGPSLNDVREGSHPFWSYGARLTIPIGNRSARYRYKIGKAEKAQSLLTLKRLEQTIMVDVDNAVKLAQVDFQRIEATRQARLFAEAALDAEQKKLESGKSTSFVVLELQRNLTAERSREVEALADYNTALARLALTEGATLERHRLQLRAQ